VGLMSWFAVVSANAASLTIRDWWERDKYPGRIGIPKWGIALVWVVSSAATFLSVVLFRKVYR
jgi:hypothetical protein